MRRLVPVILIAVTILAYMPVFKNGFVYDDHFQIERNPYIKDFRHLNVLLTKDVWHFSPNTKSNNYRPLHMISYLLIYKLSGLNPVVYHAFGLLFYVLTVLLIWKIYTHYVDSLPAFSGALLFAAHPVHVEVVAWIGGFPDLLCCLFLLLSFYLYRGGRLAFSLLSFLFAVFSKETALVFPALVASDYALFRKQDRNQTILWGAGAGMLILFYAGLRVYALGSFMRTTQDGFHLLSMAHSTVAFAGFYLGKMLFPFQLNAFYHFIMPLSFKVSWSGILLSLSALLLAYAMRKNRVFVLGCIWFVLFLIPALTLKDVSPVLFAERYLYLSSAGLILALVALPLKRYFFPILIAIAIGFAGMSYARTKVWHDDLSLWKDTVEKSPLSHTVNYNIATAYLKNREYAEARQYYQSAIQIESKKADSYYNLAICEFHLGHKDVAADLLR
ncbi:MAG: tetratricopeptide repeat protein, partial [Acidobacteriota bacterium]